MSNNDLPEWERVLRSAAHLQQILPDAVLVGGTAAAIYAEHRLSSDADHVLTDLRARFDTVLAELEAVAGWTTARVKRPVLILGSLDGIETGIRQLTREAPLETAQVQCMGQMVTLPTRSEILRIKGLLILKRNATRDYLDFVALSGLMGEEGVIGALASFDRLYPQPNGESPLQQLQIQFAQPMPFDLDATQLAEYKRLNPQLQDWTWVQQECARIAVLLFDRVSGQG